MQQVLKYPSGGIPYGISIGPEITKVLLYAAGGGGGGSQNSTAQNITAGGGGGGGGGEYCELINMNTSPIRCQAIIGKGGNGGDKNGNPLDGEDGGDTTLLFEDNTTITVKGGQGGQGGTVFIPGKGGNGGKGSLNLGDTIKNLQVQRISSFGGGGGTMVNINGVLTGGDGGEGYYNSNLVELFATGSGGGNLNNSESDTYRRAGWGGGSGVDNDGNTGGVRGGRTYDTLSSAGSGGGSGDSMLDKVYNALDHNKNGAGAGAGFSSNAIYILTTDKSNIGSISGGGGAGVGGATYNGIVLSGYNGSSGGNGQIVLISE